MDQNYIGMFCYGYFSDVAAQKVNIVFNTQLETFMLPATGESSVSSCI